MRALRDELVWLYSRLSDGVPATPIQRLRREVTAREGELVRLHRRLQPASRARAAALGVGGATEVTPTAQALRRQLPSETVVLEYFQAGDELVLFVFDARSLSAHRLGSMEEVRELIDRYRYQVSKFGLGDEYIAAHAASLQANVDGILADLYDELVGAAADK